jgi:predicted unusual protein kinase regulating ubiquinone biosynthesis (AarF/ABC1/UbiB family)
MISLIFRGHLRDTGEEVVIKILKNNIHTTLDYSCLNLYHIYLVFVVILYPFTNGVLLMVLKSLIKSSEYLTDQCNLTIEYENINRIRQELVKLPYFVVPVTYNKGESNFIVMDYLQGQLCDTLESETGVVYAKHLLSYTLYSVLYCSYMHLDLHLGNLIFMSRDDAPAIGIIDCGIMVHLDKDLKKSILCSLNLFYRSSTGKYGKMNVVKMANSIFEPPITHEMLGDKHDQLATIIMEYTDGIFAGVFNDKVLSETVLKISELTGNKCQFKIGIGRIFMGITILNRVILQFIKWDKKVYIGMLLDVLCELA